MGRRRSRRRLPDTLYEADIRSLSHDGRGVAHLDGKATFIHGALPGERVRFQYTARRSSHDEGETREILRASPDRVTPVCAGFGRCGGCSLQHLAQGAQRRAKQQSLLDSLQRIGKVTPESILPALYDESWGYRRKARLGVKHVHGKGRVLVGFRERGSSFVADLEKCHVLHPAVGEKLLLLAKLIAGMSLFQRIPQIEVAMDDSQCVLVFRVLDPPNDSDREKLRDFAHQQNLHIYLQPGGPDSIQALDNPVRLHYRLPAFDLDLEFQPEQFTQVNSAINRKMVHQAVTLLAPRASERILDLFCGVGNFSLALARSGAQVTGVEGDAALVRQAERNARHNGLANVRFFLDDLYQEAMQPAWSLGAYDKVLLDPPRSGAQQVLGLLNAMRVRRILYVSCYPGTLARDAGILVHEFGYRLTHAGIMDMFPHTAHVESMAVFERGGA